MIMVKLLVIQDPHYKFFVVRFKVFVGNPWNLFFFFLFSPNNETVVAFSISHTTTCFKGLLELRKDGETRQQLTDAIYSSPDWHEWHIEQIQRVSQSRFVHFSDRLSNYWLLTTSRWLSLAAFSSHTFKENPMSVGQYRHCLLKFVSLPFITLSLPAKDIFCLSLSSVFMSDTSSLFFSWCRGDFCPLVYRNCSLNTVRYISSFVFYATLHCWSFM